MSGKDLFEAIARRDLKAVSRIIHQPVTFDTTLNEFEDGTWPISDLRARLSLEQRDDNERVGANTWQDRDSEEYGVPRTGPID